MISIERSSIYQKGRNHVSALNSSVSEEVEHLALAGKRFLDVKHCEYGYLTLGH